MNSDPDPAGGEKPLDRLHRAGVESLSDAELVSLLVDRDLSDARSLVREGLPAFARKPWLSARPPVTRRQAARVIASLELARRLSSIVDERQPVTDCIALARRLMARYAFQVQEHLGAVYLDSKHRVLREREIYVGTLNFATVSTRDILRFALEDHAASVIVYHNHPSGDPEPSADDLLFTRKLVDAGKLLGIDVLDHLVLGSCRFVSLKERGVI